MCFFVALKYIKTVGLFAWLSINFGCDSTKDALLLAGKFLGLIACLQPECTTHQGVFISCISLMLCRFYYCYLCDTVGVLALFLFCPKRAREQGLCLDDLAI